MVDIMFLILFIFFGCLFIFLMILWIKISLMSKEKIIWFELNKNGDYENDKNNNK